MQTKCSYRQWYDVISIKKSSTNWLNTWFSKKEENAKTERQIYDLASQKYLPSDNYFVRVVCLNKLIQIRTSLSRLIAHYGSLQLQGTWG